VYSVKKELIFELWVFEGPLVCKFWECAEFGTPGVLISYSSISCYKRVTEYCMIRINQITRARWNSAIQRHRLVSLPTSSVTLYPRSLRFDHHIQHSSIRYMSTHKYTNRLAKEKTPYLLQHQHNPVDWYSPSTILFRY